MNFFETLLENERCRFKLAIRRFESKLLCPYYTIPTNRPRAFHVETWNTRGVFVRIELFSVALDHVCILNWSGGSERENNHEKQFMSQQNQQSSLTHNIQKSYATSHCILN